MGWIALAVAAVSAVGSISSAQKAAKVSQKQAGQTNAQAEEVRELALKQEAQINAQAVAQAALAEKQAAEQAAAARKQADEQAEFERQRAATEADFIRATAEANANQVLVKAAQEERVLYEQQKQWVSSTVARAAASGFTLSGTPTFYLEEGDRLYTEDLSWRRKIADANAEGLRWEGRTKSEMGTWASGEAAKALVRQTYDSANRATEQLAEHNRQEIEHIAQRTHLGVEEAFSQAMSLDYKAEALRDQASAQKRQGYQSALSSISSGLTAFSAAGGFGATTTTTSGGGLVGAGLQPVAESGAGGLGMYSGGGLGYSSSAGFGSRLSSMGNSTSWLTGRF